MKIKKIIIGLIVVLAALAGMNYIRLSLQKASTPPEKAKEPSLENTPVRVYGIVEPLGREVYIGPLQPRRVLEVTVKEGDRIEKNDVLLRLDDELERKSLIIAQSRLDEAIKRLEILKDELARKDILIKQNIGAAFEVSQLELQEKLQEQQIETAHAEIELQKTQIEKLVLRSPISGVVYKMDIRVGEQLTPQDYSRIVLGSQEKQVRMFVEAFWRNSIKMDEKVLVKDGTTLSTIGKGTVVSVLPYMGARDFRTEDPLERTDTKYQQVIVTFDSSYDVPIGLLVQCELIKEDLKQ
jgi:multidrug efflux pump subunit AcrA (membrane-fusion protein)